MNKITKITVLAIVSVLGGCASVTTEYKTFEGMRAGIVAGKGGAKVVVDGMEIWEDGEPPRKFKILGFIDETRKADWMSIWLPSSHPGDIVKKAREAGGDAVIKVNTQSQLDDFYTAAGAAANVYDLHVRSANYDSGEKQMSKYAVIKYVK
jgi:hypothetical protein